MRSGVDLIQSERDRQLKEWTYAHDREHKEGELLRAAAALLMLELGDQVAAANLWPWEKDRLLKEAQRPNTHATHLRRLQKSGALVAADLDRRIR